MTLLSIEDLSVLLPGRAARPVLDQVTLGVNPGEVVGLVGESGSGKSVTARSALGLWPDPCEVHGRVVVDGIDVRTAAPSELTRIRTSVASMIFQDPRAGINPIRRIGDFLTEGLRRTHGWSAAAAETRAVELLRAVGLDGAERHLRQYPHELSGGMLQRVMIAGALAGDPELLLCDEPTTALDVTTQAEIVGLLRSLQAERGLGVLFITHDLDLAAAICDRVYVMYAGQVVESGPAAGLFAQPGHPYTAGLLASTPDLVGAHQRLVPVPGTPMGLWEAPAGCVFRSRCGFALEALCDVQEPQLTTAGDRQVRCLRAPELATDLLVMAGRSGGEGS